MPLIGPAAWWGLAAAIPAVVAEYLYRTLPGLDGSTAAYLRYLPLWLVLQLSIGYSIYRLVTTPNTSLLDVFIVWSFSTTFMRIFVTTILLRDHVGNGTWFALALLMLAKVAQVFWGR